MEKNDFLTKMNPYSFLILGCAKVKFIIFSVYLLLHSLSSLAEDKVLTFSYWSQAGPPFVFLSNNSAQEIEGGLVKDLAELISMKLNAKPRFINMPVKRLEFELEKGAVDLNCITNPVWKKNPNQYHWSPVLFSGADRFLVRSSNKAKLTSIADLKGKSLGIYKGYTYHPDIMKMIEAGEINALKVNDIDHGIKLLLLDRIDALIDFDMLLNYKIKNEYSETLVLADLFAESYDLFCAYSKNASIEKSQLEKVFNELVTQGEIKKLLGRYL